jgi:hypothetical protein
LIVLPFRRRPFQSVFAVLLWRAGLVVVPWLFVVLAVIAVIDLVVVQRRRRARRRAGGNRSSLFE